MEDHVKTEVIYVPIEEIKPNSWNPNMQNTDMFNALVENIKEIGMVEPILLVPDLDDEGTYIVISGEHRYEACKALGYTEVPAIVKDDFDIDMQKFQTVRMNVLKGKLDPVRFTQLFDDMAEKYGEQMTKEMMKFVDEKAFNDVYMDVKRELPKEMQDQLDKSKSEIKTVDDLSRILNELFSKYGNTLDRNWMMFTYGGKVHLWVVMSDTLKKKLVDKIVEDFKEHNIDASAFFELLIDKYGEELVDEMISSGDYVVEDLEEVPEEEDF